MGAVYFYHLTRNPADVTLVSLIGKAREQGWRVLVRGNDDQRLDWLDQKLWLSGGDESFLAHGKAGSPYDADQPVLLCTNPENSNAASCLMSIDGADLSPDEINGCERACILFDGHDYAAVQHARDQWKSLTGAGCAAQYWSEESGRWEKKAET
ncbi:DNA polymerase III subunit chi [Shimia sp. FJ5]|uniref:DNA polymerase III subunit chi n=1 Tax=Shimia sp. FJ5 TaxID=3079054 RepID=UPI0026360DF5|nr:DNA polymerase III subunit chi [Shimia sp. FJ5]MDV4145723.1 DNA polymerase III subunit chi [Shimia sp. FJ5]